jgi:hypothetical protein
VKARDVLGAVFGNSGERRADSAAVIPAVPRDPDGIGASATWLRSAGRGLLGGALAIGLLLALGAVPALAAAPTATVENATNVEYTSADFAGTVSANGSPTQWRFEYISDAAYQANINNSFPGFKEASVPLAGSTTSSEPVGGHVEGLHPGTLYHLRLKARNVHGSSTPVASNFTTKAVTAPVVSEVEATEVEYATFTAKGKVEVSNSDPAFNASNCRFEVVTQAQWEAAGNHFPEGPFTQESEEPVRAGCNAEPVGVGTTSVEARFEGPGYWPYLPPPYLHLPAGTTYHLRLVAETQSGAAGKAAAASTFTTKPVPLAGVTGPTQSSVTTTSAHISATVSPNSPEPVTPEIRAGYNVHWFVRCTPECGFASSPEGEVEAGQPPTAIATDLVLQPNLQYTVRLNVINAGGDTISQTVFTTPPAAPIVSYPVTGGAINRSANGMRFAGFVNPNNAVLTDCHFDYGTTSAYGQSVPCEVKPTGGAPARVEANVTELLPATAYHFRLVAANATGPAVGADMTAHTFPTPVVPTCSNEAVRAEEHAQGVAECRAWEMVSPLDKNGGGVLSEAANVISSTDGNGVVYGSRSGFADTKSTGPVGITQYLARRGQEGWDTTAISPLQNHAVLQTLFTRDEAGIFSEDLSKGIFFAYDLPGATDDFHSDINIYQEDSASGGVTTLNSTAQLGAPDPGFPLYVNLNSVGASADVEVDSFPSINQLLPNATPGVENAYEWDHGTLRVAGILPNGDVPATGSSVPHGGSFYLYRESVSADGSRVAFMAEVEGQKQLFLRRDHTSTARVSESEGSTPVPAPEHVHLDWMSPDGHHLLFTTTSQLVDTDTNGGLDLYLYTDGPNPKSENNLTLISGPEGAAGGEMSEEDVLGASDDAGRIYYLGDNCHCGYRQIYYWDHGVTKQLSSENLQGREWGSTDYPGNSRVSSDGLHMAVLTSTPLTPQETHEHQQVYVYDAQDGAFTCASCNAIGDTQSEATVIAHATSQGLTKEMPSVKPRWLSADGKRVFFTTAAALVPEDKNGVEDVYSYDTQDGQRRLITSGRGEEGAWFENASKDGSDVFFVTRQSLVGRDGDELVDLYDARVNGGFVEPPPPPAPCSGEGCRGPLSSATPVNSPATSSFSGPGNPKPKHKHHHHKKRHHHRRSHHRGGHR